MSHPDVLVLGGGPAGLAAAIAVRQKGLAVTVADYAVPPIDKACGEGLMPDSIAALEALGVTIPNDEGALMCGIRLIEKDRSIVADFPSLPGRAVRRTILHQHLVTRAADLGVKMQWGVKRVSFHGQQAVIDGERVHSRFLVGADGQNSRVRDHAGLNGSWYESKRFGFRQHFRVQPWSNHVEIYWGKGKQIFVAPISGDQVSVALTSDRPAVRLNQALGEFALLYNRLASCTPTSPERGALTVSRRLKRVSRGNVALIGDASGSVDSITGEGMYLAFRQAGALADCIARNSLEEYDDLHRCINRRPRLMARLMLLLAHFPGIRRKVFHAFSTEQQIFDKLLAIHIGEGSWGSLRREHVVQIGLRSLFHRGPFGIPDTSEQPGC
jgi:flavin-dependent dehydrogenase